MRILFWSWPRLEYSGSRIPVGSSANIFAGGSLHSYQQVLRHATTNTGNYIHWEAPSRFIECDFEQSIFYQPKSPVTEGDWADLIDTANKNFDAVSISFANSLRPDADMRGQAKFIEGLETKVLLYGLGLQEWFDPTSNSIKSGTRSFLEVADKKASLWAVRGKQTSDWLSHYGVKTAIPTGCPSLYAFPRNILSLAKKYQRLKIAPELTKHQKVLTAGHLQRGRIVDEEKSWRVHALNDLFKDCENVTYVTQGELRAYHGLKSHQFVYNPATGELDAQSINSYFENDLQFKANFHRYLMFFDPGMWRASAAHYDLYAGDRLHGGIAAMQAGVPAILFYDDDRVKEIAELFMIPNYPMKNVAGNSIDEVISDALSNFEMEAFTENYLGRLSEFRDISDERGVSLQSHFTETLKIYGR
ncbi:polysaccharide pyruvyl transferase family protein [Paracoccus sanguinis]|uniref:polysaccharide pyruvyl transferase family protein n=1 Tax=Paracoccus sanguinis TaxID=1545044 RepID=UPI0009DEEFA9|nr:polysaccharide pyruvyl transferase family protein [Paracoccus sanguinis]